MQPDTWAALRPALEEALLRDGTHTVADVERIIREGKAHLWLGEKAAFVTEFEHYPQAKALNVWLGFGDMDELLRMQPRVEAWARSQGCSFARITTRPGWERVLAPTGFRKSHVCLIKEL